MTRASQIARWAFWKLFYLFCWPPKSLDDYMIRTQRTWSPWWKFRPNLYHNDDGNRWEICFSNEADYTEIRTLSVEAHIGMDSGRIVGLTIYDEALERTCP